MHIDRCPYIYHVHPANTCHGDQNAFIQTEPLNIHDQYIYPLVERWCDLNGLRKIDLEREPMPRLLGRRLWGSHGEGEIGGSDVLRLFMKSSLTRSRGPHLANASR